MAEISKHPITNLHRMSDSMQSAYLSHNLGNTVVPDSRTPAVILNVVSFNKGSLVLQEQSSQKLLQINKEHIKGVDLNQLAKNDQLILLSSDSKTATFELKKSGTHVSHSIKIINSGLADVLKKVWPEISADILRKVSPDVIGSLRFDGGSTLGAKFSQALIDIVKVSQQPFLDVKFSASVKQFSGNSIALQIHTSNGMNNAKSLELSLPLTTELKQKLKPGLMLEIQLNASSNKRPLVNLTGSKFDAVSETGLSEINKIVNLSPRFKKDIEALLSKLLFSKQNVKTHDVVIEGSKIHIGRLPQLLQQSLLDQSANKPFSKQDAQLIVQPKIASTSNAIDLTWLAKPQIFKIDILSLSKLSDAFTRISTFEGSSLYSDTSNTSNSFKQNINNGHLKPVTNSLIQGFLSDKTVLVESPTIKKLVQHSRAAKDKSEPIENIDVNKIHNKKALLKSLSELLSQEQLSVIGKTENIQANFPKVLKQLLLIRLQAEPHLKGMLDNALPSLSKIDRLNASEINQLLYELVSPKAIKEIVSESAIQPMVADRTNNVVQQLLTQSTSSSMINGLVKVLTASLLAKLNLPTAELGNILLSLAQSTNQDKKSNPNKNLNSTTKAIQELSRLDPQGRLFEQINAILNKHRMQKFKSLESSIQGNESVQYSIPNPFSADAKDFEIVIKKEQEQQNSNENEQLHTTWSLTMRLSVGNHGEALAKVKLSHQNISLNLYASSEKLKNRIEKNLPLLNQRLEQAGFNIQASCFATNIPDSIFKTSLQMVHAYA